MSSSEPDTDDVSEQESSSSSEALAVVKQVFASKACLLFAGGEIEELRMKSTPPPQIANLDKFIPALADSLTSILRQGDRFLIRVLGNNAAKLTFEVPFRDNQSEQLGIICRTKSWSAVGVIAGTEPFLIDTKVFKNPSVLELGDRVLTKVRKLDRLEKIDGIVCAWRADWLKVVDEVGTISEPDASRFLIGSDRDDPAALAFAARPRKKFHKRERKASTSSEASSLSVGGRYNNSKPGVSLAQQGLVSGMGVIGRHDSTKGVLYSPTHGRIAIDVNVTEFGREISNLNEILECLKCVQYQARRLPEPDYGAYYIAQGLRRSAEKFPWNTHAAKLAQFNAEVDAQKSLSAKHGFLEDRQQRQRNIYFTRSDLPMFVPNLTDEKISPVTRKGKYKVVACKDVEGDYTTQWKVLCFTDIQVAYELEEKEMLQHMASTPGRSATPSISPKPSTPVGLLQLQPVAPVPDSGGVYEGVGVIGFLNVDGTGGSIWAPRYQERIYFGRADFPDIDFLEIFTAGQYVSFVAFRPEKAVCGCNLRACIVEPFFGQLPFDPRACGIFLVEGVVKSEGATSNVVYVTTDKGVVFVTNAEYPMFSNDIAEKLPPGTHLKMFATKDTIRKENLRCLFLIGLQRELESQARTNAENFRAETIFGPINRVPRFSIPPPNTPATLPITPAAINGVSSTAYAAKPAARDQPRCSNEVMPPAKSGPAQAINVAPPQNTHDTPAQPSRADPHQSAQHNTEGTVPQESMVLTAEDEEQLFAELEAELGDWDLEGIDDVTAKGAGGGQALPENGTRSVGKYGGAWEKSREQQSSGAGSSLSSGRENGRVSSSSMSSSGPGSINDVIPMGSTAHKPGMGNQSKPNAIANGAIGSGARVYGSEQQSGVRTMTGSGTGNTINATTRNVTSETANSKLYKFMGKLLRDPEVGPFLGKKYRKDLRALESDFPELFEQR